MPLVESGPGGSKWETGPCPAGKKKIEKKRPARAYTICNCVQFMCILLWDGMGWGTHLDHVEFILLGLGAQQNLFDHQLLAPGVILIVVPRHAVAIGGQSNS